MKYAKLAALAVALAYGSADAAVITFQTGTSSAGAQTTANAYRDIVDAAVANSSHSTVLNNYDIVSNQSLFGAGATNIAFKSTINFGLSAAGTYSFRAGVDFGNGGAVFLDGQAVDLKTTDMWWAHDYANTNSVFSVSNKALTAGNHTLTIYGLEGCCDGGQQVQYSANGAAFQSFSASTLQMAPVPEPETYAMMLGGLGVVGAIARRRREKKQA
jgi:hypothetical protein